jgi:hypothetical protein
MAFKISRYLDELDSNLKTLSSRKQIAFAAWCAHRLFGRFERFLATKLGDDAIRRLRQALADVWQLAYGKTLILDDLSEALRICYDADWDQEDDDSDLDNTGAIETIECLIRTFECARDESSRQAAEAAERVINVIDFDLAMLEGVEDPFSHPRMRRELNQQAEFLKLLSAQPAVPSGAEDMYPEL